MASCFSNGKTIQTNLINASVKKGTASAGKLLLLAVLAGLYISIGGQFFLAALAAGAGKIVGGLAFSTGLILVVLAGAELFTGNMIILAGVLARKTSVLRMLRNWGLVYLGNFIGSILFVLLLYYSGLFRNPSSLTALGELSAGIAGKKLSLSFLQAFLRGISCNILVVLAVIMASGAKTAVSKIACIIFPITCFVACGFEHSVANMYLIPLGMMNSGYSLPETISAFKNIIPVTLGNIAGGLLIVFIHPAQLKKIISCHCRNNLL